MVQDPTIQLTNQGRRYALGYGEDFYGIWDQKKPGTPIERFPRTDDGWNLAWTRYSGLDTPGSKSGLSIGKIALIVVCVAVFVALSLVDFHAKDSSKLGTGGSGDCTAEQGTLLAELGLPEGAMPEAPTQVPEAFGPGDWCDQRVDMPPGSTADVIDFYRPGLAEGGWKIASGPQVGRMFAPGQPVVSMLAERGSDSAVIEVYYMEDDSVRLFWLTIKKGTTTAPGTPSSVPPSRVAPATASHSSDKSVSLEEYFARMEGMHQAAHAKEEEVDAAAQNRKGAWLASGDYRVLVAAMTDSAAALLVPLDALAADLGALKPPEKVRAAHHEYLSALRQFSDDLGFAMQEVTSAKEEFVGRYPSTPIIDFWTAYYSAMVPSIDSFQRLFESCNALQAIADENKIDRDVGC